MGSSPNAYLIQGFKFMGSARQLASVLKPDLTEDEVEALEDETEDVMEKMAEMVGYVGLDLVVTGYDYDQCYVGTLGLQTDWEDDKEVKTLSFLSPEQLQACQELHAKLKPLDLNEENEREGDESIVSDLSVWLVTDYR